MTKKRASDYCPNHNGNIGRHHAIAYASCQLKDHEKNYSPFLLEAAVCGMETFNEYLKGKRFILLQNRHLT